MGKMGGGIKLEDLKENNKNIWGRIKFGGARGENLTHGAWVTGFNPRPPYFYLPQRILL
jgi:hypothetical protein